MKMKDMFPLIAVDVHIRGEHAARAVAQWENANENRLDWDVTFCKELDKRSTVQYALVATLIGECKDRIELEALLEMAEVLYHERRDNGDFAPA